MRRSRLSSEGQGCTAPANARTTPHKGRFDLLYPVPCDDIDVSQARPGELGRSYSRPVTNGVSGRVQRGDGDDGEQRGDTTQERFDWTGRRQVEENPVLVLCDLRRHFEECEDQRGGLRSGQWGVRQRVGAEGMVEDVGSAREQRRMALARKVVAEVRSL